MTQVNAVRSRGSLCARFANCQVFHAGAASINKMKNLEAKFRLDESRRAEARATAIGYTRRAVLNQRDTFFRVANGKLKLREENGSAVLIYYHRDESGPLMLSDYEIVAGRRSAAHAAGCSTMRSARSRWSRKCEP